jgi:hypothetical protein
MSGMRVIFVEPSFPHNQRQFVRALADVGAEVIGIGESPTEFLDDELKSWMKHYHQVRSVVDVDEMTDAVRWLQDKLWVDRLEAVIEAHTLPVAQVRERCTIPGTSLRTTWLCRDKPSMKEALRAVGVPTAASIAADNAEQVWAFADSIGYPLILKPRAGAGALDTTRVDGSGSGAALAMFGGQGGSRRSRSRSSSRGHEGSTNDVDRRPGSRLRLTTTSANCPRRRAHALDSQFASTRRVDTVDEHAQLKEDGPPRERARIGHEQLTHLSGSLASPRAASVLR